MRIVNRKEFLKLPTPFMYVKYNPIIMGDLAICVSFNHADAGCLYNNVALKPAFDSWNKRMDAYEEMLKDSTRDIEVRDNTLSWDGLYDEDQLFLVYSKRDFEIFVDLMQKYLDIYGTNKDILYTSD